MLFLTKTKHTQILELKSDYMYHSRISCSTKRHMSCLKNSTDNIMVVVRGEGHGRKMKVVKGVKCMVTMTFSGKHNAVHRWCTLEMYTWNLYIVTNQCYPNKVNTEISDCLCICDHSLYKFDQCYLPWPRKQNQPNPKPKQSNQLWCLAQIWPVTSPCPEFSWPSSYTVL